MDPIVWAILLMILGLALVVLEIFIPSGGILGFLAICSIVGSVGMAFVYHGSSAGFLFVLIAIVGLPTAAVLAFRWWPETSIGRRVLLDAPGEEDVLPEEDPRNRLRELIGKLGTARADMFPGGSIRIDGESYEAVSEGMPIDKGQTIEVVDIQNNRLVVRPSDQEVPPPKSDDLLSRPIDVVGLDPFDDPLA
ncbi:MAG: hypothetical protein DWQ31_21710 [Planctomycetota bacterium]|nr:MAG: hypothetical protein DWQ31_21710 [Planctomycetota bacterium]REJ93718.1 MAG: hypothetical protein DWQ35_10245 [Planctomycetota bacterium]REK25766.1 MAG: hypothetical protein DWQ42_10980 [Planctomycetota bacterium]REK46486.1 MAG: hypothetical protein DWQ46_06325 [Planctomycetota bacterium]